MMRVFMTMAMLVSMGFSAKAEGLVFTDMAVTPALKGGDALVVGRIVNETSATVVLPLEDVQVPAAGLKLIVYGRDEHGLTSLDPTQAMTLPPGETYVIPRVYELRFVGVTHDILVGTEIPLRYTLNGRTYAIRVPIKNGDF
ncbi:MAG: hypothetical protein COY40_03915 [Alphaproteobacteria bacterium CG_4_10_14_0_8_um_filter_53_9]|nr:MAG: hypothetical protein COY40_03915 [Alphaproteobacteria bacterium CG_4_10_14_0_8_um_filter_53_9]